MSVDVGVLEAAAGCWQALCWDSPVGVPYSAGCEAVAEAPEDCYCWCSEV